MNGKSKSSDTAASSEADAGCEDSDVENCSKGKSLKSQQICKGKTADENSDSQKIAKKACSGVSDIDESSNKGPINATKDIANSSSDSGEKINTSVTVDSIKDTAESTLSDEARLERELAKLEKMPKITVKLSRLTGDELKLTENKPKTESLPKDSSQTDAEKCPLKEPEVKRKSGESDFHVFSYDACRALE
jgi:hypothetical protein